MYITHIKLKNWRNFREAETNLAQRAYVIGPNASGKSNLLDAFRFFRDICKPAGGGLQKAVLDRGSMSNFAAFTLAKIPKSGLRFILPKVMKALHGVMCWASSRKVKGRSV